MSSDYVKGFHELPKEERVKYHLSARKEGLSLDDALLLDGQKLASTTSPKTGLKTNPLTNLHTFSPKGS